MIPGDCVTCPDCGNAHDNCKCPVGGSVFARELNETIDAYIEIWEHKARVQMDLNTDLMDAAKMRIKATTAEELKLAIAGILKKHGLGQ